MLHLRPLILHFFSREFSFGKVLLISLPHPVPQGWFTNGTVFNSSPKEEPLKFQLGEGEVIEGWEQGLMNMW